MTIQEQLDEYICSMTFTCPAGREHAFGGHVHVVHAGQVLFSRGYGYRDLESNQPNTCDTSFRIGSATKQFTAAAILVLEESQMLSVSDSIEMHIPEYPAIGADLTIHQLLTHTSGLLSYTDIESVMQTEHKERTPMQLVETFWDKPLVFAPGTRYQYSDSGYAILGLLIERISGRSYADFLRDAIFEPAGLLNTRVGDAEQAHDRAEGYTLELGKFVAAEPVAMSVPYAAGAVRSTSSDLARWHAQLLSSTILNETSTAKLYEVEREGYAYGWQVREAGGSRHVSHTGGIKGFLTYYLRILERDLVIVVWSNNMAVPSAPIEEFESIVRFAEGAALHQMFDR